MNAWPIVAAALVAGAMATGALAEEPAQPPMNDFLQAFYVCEGAAFLIEHSVGAAAMQLLVRDVSEPPPDIVLGELVKMITRYLLGEHT